MAEGIAGAGDIVRLRDEATYVEPDVDSDISVFYGLEGNLPRILRDHRRNFASVYIDLGYWGRREGGRWTGYHKIVVDGRHPTAYFRRHQGMVCNTARLEHFKLVAQPWRASGAHILLAGMGDKGAAAEGWEPNAWEQWAVAQIRAVSARPIIYRPKPSWKTAFPVPGAHYSAPHVRPLEQDLKNCWAVVTHHSNVAVDALVAGIPAFCWEGVAAPLSNQDWSRMESPEMPADGRVAWMADIAFTQWSIAEMRAGLPWKYLREETLL